MFVNLFSFFVFLAIVAIGIGVLIYSIMNCKKLIKKYNEQNIKAINLYLDKKLISKLLDKLSTITNEYGIQSLIDDIFNYYGIDFMVLKNISSKKIIRYGESTQNIITDEEFRNLFDKTEKIKSDIGYLHINNKSVGGGYVLFKNHDVAMIILADEDHELSFAELETLANEIMHILRSSLKLHATSL